MNNASRCDASFSHTYNNIRKLNISFTRTHIVGDRTDTSSQRVCLFIYFLFL